MNLVSPSRGTHADFGPFYTGERFLHVFPKFATCIKLLVGILKGARGHPDSCSCKTRDSLDLSYRSVLG